MVPAAPKEDDELSRYLKEPALPNTADPLQHWHNSLAAKYPTLARLARRAFSIVASSVASERLFSKAGHLFNQLRARLDPSLGELQLFVQQNLARLPELERV